MHAHDSCHSVLRHTNQYQATKLLFQALLEDLRLTQGPTGSHEVVHKSFKSCIFRSARDPDPTTRDYLFWPISSVVAECMLPSQLCLLQDQQATTWVSAKQNAGTLDLKDDTATLEPYDKILSSGILVGEGLRATFDSALHNYE